MGANDGNLAVASDGTYAGGGAGQLQAGRHVYVHAVAVDTEGGIPEKYRNPRRSEVYGRVRSRRWSSGLLGKTVPRDHPRWHVARRYEEEREWRWRWFCVSRPLIVQWLDAIWKICLRHQQGNGHQIYTPRNGAGLDALSIGTPRRHVRGCIQLHPTEPPW